MAGNRIDTVDTLMAHYVAGSLPEPARVLVASHLEMCPTHSRLVHDLETLAGETLESAPPVDIVDRDVRLASIFASTDMTVSRPRGVDRSESGKFPEPLRDFIGFDLPYVPWRAKLPGFKEYSLGDIDGCDVSLMWIRAGRRLPTHTHRGMELTLVLDGAFADAHGRYGPGDISFADNSVVHRPVAEKDGPCIAFLVLEAPIAFKGPLTRLVGDLIG